MATIQQQVRDAFLEKLASSKAVSKSTVERLRELMEDDKKLKADDVVKLLTMPPSDGVA